MTAKESTNIDMTTRFESLASLPISLRCSQCKVYKHEILICGGLFERDCYSYHMLKNEYKYICSYPVDIELRGHCVVKLIDSNANDITLLSFGSRDHTLKMKYKSVWYNENNETEKNEWMPIFDNKNERVYIRSSKGSYLGARAVIGGSNNNLLFITYYPKDIDVYNLDTFQYINFNTLPMNDSDSISHHCFVAKSKNEQILFYKKTGLLINYDETNSTFKFQKMRVCTSIKDSFSYGFIHIDDFIFFFGGRRDFEHGGSNEIHKYSVTENKWIKLEYTLPIELADCNTILSEDNKYVHIIGGTSEGRVLATHMKTRIEEWIKSKGTNMEEQETIEEEEKIEKEEYEKRKKEEEINDIKQIKSELGEMQYDLDIKKLKKTKEIEMIIEHWMHSLSGKIGWIDDFNIIILHYVLMKYFKPIKVIQGYSDNVNNVKFSPDSTKIVTTLDDSNIRVLDVETRREIHLLKGHLESVTNAKFSWDGNFILSCSKDKTIRLWDLKLGTEIIKFEGHTNVVNSAQFSPNGNIIVSGSNDQTIRIWDARSGQEMQHLRGHSDHVNDVEISHDGQQIVSASNDKTIAIWDIMSGKRIRKLKGHSGDVLKVGFSTDDSCIVSCSSDRTIRMWEAMSGIQVRQLGGHFDLITDLRLFSDNQTIVSCSNDMTIRLWDVYLGMEIQKLEGHFSEITGLDVSLNEKKYFLNIMFCLLCGNENSAI
ncbi:hypothetical protein RFI_32390 [Reticulomyxa filosa]|uniref:Uncharacterized protein n=1 Tax=Reticulomyxa filosa TaxID=46433 RepID=X6LUG0_RETFI|nr:hypothetical protein RFI_32390 [Reticulomyxa filosa]|eukprot:ETO05006.1 hypothetical protein RFI_32390 [Reticulomyxa filosa]